jgi:hypothetical protein
VRYSHDEAGPLSDFLFERTPHAVERLGERREFVLSLGIEFEVEVSLGYTPRRLLEPSYRVVDRTGEVEREEKSENKERKRKIKDRLERTNLQYLLLRFFAY